MNELSVPTKGELTELTDLPLKFYLDKETNTITIESDYNVIISTNKNLVTKAKNNIMLGESVHLNPKLSSIDSPEAYSLDSIENLGDK